MPLGVVAGGVDPENAGIGRIIGTETAQSPSSDGEGCYFLLPNSNVMAMASTMYSVRPSGDRRDTRGVVPDLEVKEGPSARRNGVDTVMDFTRALIERERRVGTSP